MFYSSGYGRIGLVETVVRLLWRINPGSVLDIGCGVGFYGALIRVFLDRGRRPDSTGGDTWKLRLTGVDPMPFQWSFQELYDHVVRTGIEELLEGRADKELGTPEDLILLFCMLNHLPKEVGDQVLRWSLDRGQNVLVAVPTTVYSIQGGPVSDGYEGWRTEWTREEILAYPGASLVVTKDGCTLVWFKGKNWVDRRVSGWKDLFEDVGGKWEWL